MNIELILAAKALIKERDRMDDHQCVYNLDGLLANLRRAIPEAVRPAPTFEATCCKCGKVDKVDRNVMGVYYCGYGCT